MAIEVTRHETVKYYVTLDAEDAEWLRGLLQNAISGGSEKPEDYERRKKLFDSLKT